MQHTRSRAWFSEAKQRIPGGVNSPVRAFGAVGGQPLFIRRARGAYLYDVDGNRYLDYVLSWGPLILGHAHPRVVAAVQQAAGRGTSYGAPTPAEVELAGLVQEAFPSMERVRFVNSGTEATMSAIRLARGVTGRPKIIKFQGCYHGHADYLLVQAGSGAMTLGVPDSAGVPKDFARHTLNLPYNDLGALRRAMRRQGKAVAAVIVEPVAGNMGVVPSEPGFLEGLREITARHGALLIFDEVITGFRLAYGGAQERYGVTPDLTCLGKIIGGGLPVGVYGGSRDLMEHVAPLGPVYQAGTLSGNPLAMAAGIATLKALRKRGVYRALEARSEALSQGLAAAASKARVSMTLNRVGSMLTAFFTDQPVKDYVSAKAADTRVFARFFRGMLREGVFLAPSQFEAGFLSMAHTDRDVEKTLRAAQRVLKRL